MSTERRLAELAKEIARHLKAASIRLVLAESCTGGLASAMLTRVPGISEFHCGSAVVYQCATKAAWLHVSRSLLRNPGAVSREVAERMAAGALKVTPHADVAASVTGHLGPDAPRGQDGKVFMACAWRKRAAGRPIVLRRIELTDEPEDQNKQERPATRRLRRQRSATAHLLRFILEELTQQRGSAG